MKDKPAWKTKSEKLEELAKGIKETKERLRNLGRHPKTYVDVMYRLYDFTKGRNGPRWVLKLKAVLTYDNIRPSLFERFKNLFYSFLLVKFVEKSKYFLHRSDLEFFWTIIPTLILVLLAIPSLHIIYLFDIFLVDSNPMLTIKVIGNQWFWTYEYCVILDVFYLDFFLFTFDSYMLHLEDLSFLDFRLLATDNPLFVPINIPIRFIVTASDVLHSWAVPSLGIKLDACPGRLNQFYSLIDRIGEFYGQCSEICGINHGFMPIEIVGLQ